MAETAENWDLHAVVRSCSSTAIDATTIRSTKYGEERNTSTIVDGNSVHHEINNNNNPLSFLSSLKFEDEEDPFCFPNLLQEERNNGLGEWQDSYKPFFPTNIGRDDIIVSSSSSSSCALGGLTSQQQQLKTSISTSTDSPLTPTSSSPIFVFGEPKSQRSRHVQPQPQRVQQDLQLQQQQQQPGASNCLRPMQSQAPVRSRKRKTPQKRMVCHVTAENLSADLWAWRKYGQKPIKGSPYPRNYYRCSSSKGCAARKQVERSNTDPSIFIVSYTGDHTHPRPTHRNSLAGSSRNKFSRAQNSPNKENSTSAPPSVAKASCSSPISSSGHSLTAPEEEKNSTVENRQLQGGGEMDNEMVIEEFDDEDELLIPNLAAAMNEDLFKGFDATSTSNSL